MRKFAICSIAGQLEWDVHADGCQDVERGKTLGTKSHNMSNGKKIQRIYNSVHVVEADSVDQAIDNEVQDLNADFGEDTWNPDYFNIMPCAKKSSK